VSRNPTFEEEAARAVAADYDRVADEYARHIYAELAGKPFDRKLLDRFATLVGGGRICDVGCGPGHVARYLYERGCDVVGIDLSPRMVQLAAELNPGVEFRVDDLRSLQLTSGSLAGIVAFYSLIHLRADQLAPALAELRRVLRPGGRLLLAVHEGDETRRPGELWGIPVTLQFNFFTREQLTAVLLQAGFTIEQISHRAPYPEVEVATDRLYITAVATDPEGTADQGSSTFGAPDRSDTRRRIEPINHPHRTALAWLWRAGPRPGRAWRRPGQGEEDA
jgi:SAM-dependent methyltransferase